MATPDFTFVDGFDTYHPAIDLVNSSGALNLSSYYQTDYTVGSSVNIIQPVAALTGTGCAVQLTATVGSSVELMRGMNGNYARSIGGFCIRLDSVTTVGISGVSFIDSTTIQLSIGINTSGKIEVRRGNAISTVIATSTETVILGSTNFLEWDVTIHNTAGIVKVWLNGVLTSINLTGQNTRAGTNNYFNGAGPCTYQGNKATFDHFYCFCYTTSGGSETPLLTNPIIDTAVPSSDSAVAFTAAAGQIGNRVFTVSQVSSTLSANSMWLLKITPPGNCTLNSVTAVITNVGGAYTIRAVLYADSSGSPGSLIASGPDTAYGTGVVGNQTAAFTTGQSLTGGTSYWIGFMTNQTMNTRLAQVATTNITQGRTATFSSGAPNPAGAMSVTNIDITMWGNLTGLSSANWFQEGIAFSVGRYNQSATVGNEDLYNLPSLATTPTAVHLLAVKGILGKTDGGARTVDLEVKSGATTGSGSSPGINPALSATGYQTIFWNDPATGAAWTGTAAGAAKIGYKIAS